MRKICYKSFVVLILLMQASCFQKQLAQVNDRYVEKEAETVLRNQVLKNAEWAMQQEPLTITSVTCPRSAGDKHDFFSEADYFWPDPQNPGGPYKERDGVSNPDNFVEHRKLMIRLSKIIGTLASAYKLTGDPKYAKEAQQHLEAWFVSSETRMNPSLQFAQAVHGRSTGRNYGIIDTIHLMEVAQGTLVMEDSGVLDPDVLAGVKKWFANYIWWLNFSEAGRKEKGVKNNHSTCWAMQVASFARLCDDQFMLNAMRERFKSTLLPNQMGVDGSFPLELKRTKPYGYSIFNLDAMAMLCQILSTADDDLWTFQTADGKSVKKGIDYLYPFIADKSSWKLKPDVMYWDKWPVAQPFLIFGADRFHQNKWLEKWKKLDHFPTTEEVIRNLPIRNPLIWM
ncbi:alginate lyase [Pedobacter sp. HMF7647]|uniref:Alginate lyase n=1 Tax=Hufsiella arboris TaxID=2695275 RepID=A0A7K1Y7R1_9SPHI|nr:alginate lyase family protein [Hufsiella arboris]MXV50159.1 alginate lyase [Hufsiella arboris]